MLWPGLLIEFRVLLQILVTGRFTQVIWNIFKIPRKFMQSFLPERNCLSRKSSLFHDTPCLSYSRYGLTLISIKICLIINNIYTHLPWKHEWINEWNVRELKLGWWWVICDGKQTQVYNIPYIKIIGGSLWRNKMY